MITKKILLAFVAFPFFSLQASAGTKKLIYFGGGGEPDGPTTIFDGSFARFAKFSQRADWDAKIYFDGKHRKSQEMATKILGSKPAPFTVKNYGEQIKKTTEALRNGQFSPGDQLMVILDTHGNRREKGQLHTVEASNGTVSTEELQTLRDAAEAKGVKLAIIDGTCFGGETLKLAGPNTCVVSLSLAHRMSTSEDDEAISGEFKKGISLEEAFLKGRKKSPGDSQPQITSERGLIVQRVLADLDRALYDFEDIETEAQETKFCRNLDLSFQGLEGIKTRINEYLKNLNGADTTALGADVNSRLASIAKKIEDYRRQRAPMEDYLREGEMDAVCDKSDCVKIWELEDKRGDLEDNLEEDGNRKDREFLGKIVAFMKTKRYRSWVKKHELLAGKKEKLSDLVDMIAADERALYEDLYRGTHASAGAVDACRDFRL